MSADDPNKKVLRERPVSFQQFLLRGAERTEGENDSPPSELTVVRDDTLVGRTIAQAYQVAELVGVGGMGRVYRGVQKALNRTVAIKVIHPHLLGDEQTVLRFYNEAKAASRLNHPRSVSIFDFGRTEDGILYLVMEYLSGRDLSSIMLDDGPIPLLRVVRITQQILSALSEAHALSVIHRDLKPENILVTRGRRGEEMVKVVDFGLATISNTTSTSITSPGIVCGTPDYMSPEQGRGDPLDGRADIYAVGVLLFEMLTDRLPFIDDTPTKVVLRHIHDPIPDPREIVPHRAIPISLSNVVTKALAKDRNDRFESAEEMEDALLAVEKELQRREHQVTCTRCSSVNDAAAKFCANCGAGLEHAKSSHSHATVPPVSERHAGPVLAQLSPPRGFIPNFTSPLAVEKSLSNLMGRDEWLERFRALREEARDGGALWFRLVGDIGIGKTRLLQEFRSISQEALDLCFVAGPHPSGALVPYFAIKQLVAAMLGADLTTVNERLRQWQQSTLPNDRVVQAGLFELLEPRGIPGLFGDTRHRVSRAVAVSALLAELVRQVHPTSASGLIVLAVDDLDRCDQLTSEVLAGVVDILNGDDRKTGRRRALALLLVTTSRKEHVAKTSSHRSGVSIAGAQSAKSEEPSRSATQIVYEPAPEWTSEIGILGPVFADDVRELIQQNLKLEQDSRLRLWGTPLFEEQLRELGITSPFAEEAPQTLADALALRFERLDAPSRRLLQAISVLGETCELDSIREVASGHELHALENLSARKWVSLRGKEVSIAHPFVRDVVIASMPQEAKRELFDRAFNWSIGNDVPLEVRADFAHESGDVHTTLLLLERVGESALTRGDHHAALHAFRSCLEVARKELLRTGDLGFERGLLNYGIMLAQAALGIGDITGTEGVLRETLEISSLTPHDRARIHLRLGEVSIHRGRIREAIRWLGLALEMATELADNTLAALIYLQQAKVRSLEGDVLAAVNTARKACETTALGGVDLELSLFAELEYVGCLRAVEDFEMAQQHAERAVGLAKSHSEPIWLARAYLLLAEIAEANGAHEKDETMIERLHRFADESAAIAGFRINHAS